MTIDANAAADRADIVPLGDAALLVRFADILDDAANRRALAFAAALDADPVAGVVELAPSLVSVLVRYDPLVIDPHRLSGELALRLTAALEPPVSREHTIKVEFDGPDLAEVAGVLGLSVARFVAAHNAAPLRVLTTGFAPGFVYCGFHPEALVVPRRAQVRPSVVAGSVLFAAGQTAITATEIPTGWHVIGHTEMRNFNPEVTPPTVLAAGDRIRFEAVS